MKTDRKGTVYPYIPNSVEEVKQRMLQELKVENSEALFEEIPSRLRLGRDMKLPQPHLSEAALRRHVEGLLARNSTAQEYLSFLGAGCYQHYVPAVCDEINQRNEFLTAYSGRAYEDHGRFQALWEYQSLMGELLEMDVVSLPTYDGYQAAATCLRMAARITGRSELVLCQPLDPDKISKIRDYCRAGFQIKLTGYSLETGQFDLAALEASISSSTAAVYFDNPNFLGCIETQGVQIAELTHQQGALLVVGADPMSLGVLAPPATYGADLVCGDIQPLGMHLQYGGGHAGYLATRDEERFVAEYPYRLVGIGPTVEPGEYGFGEVAFERTSFMKREGGKEWLGTMSNLWAITAGVYLALLGPQGMTDIGHAIMSRTQYAMRELDQINGIQAPVFTAPHFQEFVIRCHKTGSTATEINKMLLKHHIFGGKDLSQAFPELGQSAMYCFSELHTQADIDTLANALREVLNT